MLRYCLTSRSRRLYSLNGKVKYARNCIEWFKGRKMEPDENEVTQLEKITVEEDEDKSIQTSIEVWTGDGRSALLNVTEDIGQFSPFLLLYLRNIKVIDISHCGSFSAQDFLESIRACENVKELSLQGCKQFTQWHFTNYATEIKQLQYLDLEDCCSFVYGSAFILCSKLQDLRFFEFEPANITVEIREWRYLFRTFFRIQFGYSFRRILPNQGFYQRAPPYAWLDEIEE